MTILIDNASSHTAKLTKNFLDVEGLELLPHPPYSPDLAPCDFWLFPKVKIYLQGKDFNTLQALGTGLYQYFKSIRRRVQKGVLQVGGKILNALVHHSKFNYSRRIKIRRRLVLKDLSTLLINAPRNYHIGFAKIVQPCKARISINYANVVKPTSVEDVHSFHTHGPNPPRIEMIKGITNMKARAKNSEESTRLILASGIETTTDSAISTIVKFDSLKRTIRLQKSGKEDFSISRLLKI
ncbi:Transposase [Oopsacas minuta]|uniref:Transposase n=1 Tax=Oopsacas minuta TaxID=111878 RepID=A0AAV7JHM8_9METZ|nr:Transposase [Oopsacas minuta]